MHLPQIATAKNMQWPLGTSKSSLEEEENLADNPTVTRRTSERPRKTRKKTEGASSVAIQTTSLVIFQRILLTIRRRSWWVVGVIAKMIMKKFVSWHRKTSLLYLTAGLPNIMFSVCLCARFQEAPKTSHLEAMKRIFRYIKENKTNLKRTAQISVRPCCFNNPRTSSPPYQPFSPPSDYVSELPPTTPTFQTYIPHLSPTSNNNNLLRTPKTTPPPLTSPPPTPTQPSKLSSLLAINVDPIELLFSTPPTSPQVFLDSLEDLPPAITNSLPPRLSFETIERLANEPPPIDLFFPSPTPDTKPPIPPFPPQCSPNLPSNFPPLPPLGPINPFPMLTHEMFCEICQ
nr:retrovirus-related Pol polyprotein from transposon TNT 1-94 [Tanacetum cinerariifolium]